MLEFHNSFLGTVLLYLENNIYFVNFLIVPSVAQGIGH